MTRGAKGRRRNGGGLSGFILLIAFLCAVVFIVSAVTYAPLLPQYDKSASAVSDITPPHTSAPQHRQTEDGSIVPQPGWHIALYAVPPCSDTIYTLINEEGRYVINYDPATRNARWAAYILTRAEAGVKNVDRASGFVRDMRLAHKGWAAAATGDYTRSGYDRGHLVPSADRDDNEAENKATFIMTNISPQRPGLNRYVWKNLETTVRRWALEHDSLYIVTAGVLTPSNGRPLKTIGTGVAVPELFYKAVAVRDGDRFQAIGFVIPNIDDCNRDYKVYAVSPDSVRRLTGIDIFGNLPSEAVYDTGFWF